MIQKEIIVSSRCVPQQQFQRGPRDIYIYIYTHTHVRTNICMQKLFVTLHPTKRQLAFKLCNFIRGIFFYPFAVNYNLFFCSFPVVIVPSFFLWYVLGFHVSDSNLISPPFFPQNIVDVRYFIPASIFKTENTKYELSHTQHNLTKNYV